MNFKQTGDAIRGSNLTTVIPIKFLRRGARRLVVPMNSTEQAPNCDSPMLVALCRACHWQRLMDECVVESGADIARREGLHPTTVNELLRLTRLAPTVVQAILAGRQPRTPSLLWVKNHELPWSWEEQEALFGGFDAASVGTVPNELPRASACPASQ
ncbi:site-specific recombinase resolvase [Dokdonella sp.]|uniref:site-specific recombinase resolvase n=1 Tax=Dokdonella sp. TaxID=2291710 RepID=UPI0025C169E1|nr:site-specific recombinase resolvase [Dokdonella sp.]MBX3692679.1 site-specific recombinase resolvase [Dokdonella sp.]MCW5567510.1 site-specific recombinase resolvase [Dokdonella sp.]